MCKVKFRRKQLECGCCGMYFHTWPKYKDQDQDRGYGICKSCQGTISESEQKELDKLVETFGNGLSKPEHIKKWKSYDTETKEHLALQALEDGIITYSIG